MAKITISLGEDCQMTSTEVELDNLRTARKIFYEAVGRMARAAVNQKKKAKKLDKGGKDYA